MLETRRFTRSTREPAYQPNPINEAAVNKPRKELKLPHVFVLITGVILVCCLLTYLVPSGQFQREVKEIDGHKRTLVVPGTYTSIPKHYSLEGVFIGDKKEGHASPASFHGFFSAVPRGMESAADIIFFIFIIGGAFGILQRTGVITGAIQLLLDLFKGKDVLLVVSVMLVIAIGGSTLGMTEEFIPMVPIFLILSKKMGYDRIFGLAMVILAAQVGFAAATTNPFTVGIAKGIAELPLNSGMGFRLVFFACTFTVMITYMLRYGAKIKADPSKSIMAGDDFELAQHDEHSFAFTSRHGVILAACVALFGLILFAVSKWGWWMNDMAGGFFLMGIMAAVIAGLSVEETAKAFVKGMEEMVVAALVVGFAKGIVVVLEDGLIMDTVIHGASSMLVEVPKVVAVQGMFLFQSGLNFLIPSGSGQAMVTMPLMAPLADVLGITRQTAVFAYQCGDGFSNTIIPTSGVLMAMLSLAGIPYIKWFRFVFPLLIMLCTLAAIFLAAAVMINLQ